MKRMLTRAELVEMNEDGRRKLPQGCRELIAIENWTSRQVETASAIVRVRTAGLWNRLEEAASMDEYLARLFLGHKNSTARSRKDCNGALKIIELVHGIARVKAGAVIGLMDLKKSTKNRTDESLTNWKNFQTEFETLKKNHKDKHKSELFRIKNDAGETILNRFEISANRGYVILNMRLGPPSK
jgi:hypothetical protein